MTDRDEHYLSRLEFWLRTGRSHGAGTISVLADVRSHLVDSGENPYEAFGPPRTYAKQFNGIARWGWPRRGAGIAALVVLSVGCYSTANVYAYLQSQRPPWWPAPQWIFDTATLVLLFVGWRALLYFASPSLASLSGEGVDAPRAWQRRTGSRRIVTFALLIFVVVASGSWGTILGRSFVTSPKLRAANYVYSTMASGSATSGDNITVRTVIYLAAAGPDTSLNTGALSIANNLAGNEISSVQGFGTLAQALSVAKLPEWSLNGDQLTGFTVNYGTYYVLTWSGWTVPGYAPPPATQEDLIITYLVTGVGLETLSIPLSVNH